MKRKREQFPVTCNQRGSVEILSLLVSCVFFFQIECVQCQFNGFEPTVAPCSSDSTITGYTSIEDINSDIDTELGRIEAGEAPQEMYFLTLCPGTFDVSSGPLLPRLDQASFSCAGTGNSDDGCIFSGGTEVIRIEDSSIEGYIINSINFLGITFTAFTGYSVELLASAPTEAIFMDCLWKDFNATGIARISNTANSPMDLQLDFCSIVSSSGMSSDAIVDVAFENNGGSVMLDMVLINGIQVNNVFLRTVENGASVVFNSDFTANSLTKLSETMGGMSEFGGVKISESTEMVLLFDAVGEGSSTIIEDTNIDRNVGAEKYQIFRVADGATGRLFNSTIRMNNPVEYGVFVVVEEEGTTPMAVIEDSLFEGNIQEDGALVMSQGVGAYVEMARNRFVENSGGLMNIGAFFGGDIRFTQTCFVRNDHFLVVLVLEFSSFEAFDNYVEDEKSMICSGMDETQGPGRLSVEQPGSLCFRGGDNCLVDCLPNANDSPVCLADVVPTSMPSPSTSSPGGSPASGPTAQPSGAQGPIETPATQSPTFLMPVSAPAPRPSFPTWVPVPTSQIRPSVPTRMPVPTSVHPPPFRPPSGGIGKPKPTINKTPTYIPPTNCQHYYGVNANTACADDGDYIVTGTNPSNNYNYNTKEKSMHQQQHKSTTDHNGKSQKKKRDSAEKVSSKKDKKRSSYSKDTGTGNNNYGIGQNDGSAAVRQHGNFYPPSPTKQQTSSSQIGIGYAQAKTGTGTGTSSYHHGIGTAETSPSLARTRPASDSRSEYYGIGKEERSKEDEDERNKE